MTRIRIHQMSEQAKVCFLIYCKQTADRQFKNDLEPMYAFAWHNISHNCEVLPENETLAFLSPVYLL